MERASVTTIYEAIVLSMLHRNVTAMCSVLFLYSAIYISRHLSRVLNTYRIRVGKRLRVLPLYGQMLLSPADAPRPRWLRAVLLQRWSHAAEEVSSL